TGVQTCALPICIKLAHHSPPGERCVYDQSEAFPGVVVDNGQHPEPPAIGESIADKVQAPALVGLVGHDDRTPCSQGTFTAAALAHLQLLLGIKSPELLDVHLDALSLQHHMDTVVSEPAPLGGNGLHSLSQLAVVRPQTAIPHA